MPHSCAWLGRRHTGPSRMWRTSLRIGALSGAIGISLFGRAEAQEFCVACTGPVAVYRCVIDGARPGGVSLPQLCTSVIARDGKHASCAIKGGTVFDCNGPVKHVPWTAGDVQPAPGSAAAAVPPPTPKPSPAPAKQPGPNDPPQTMVDLAKRANEQTAEQMKKAGEATKKTWECVFSLFTRC